MDEPSKELTKEEFERYSVMCGLAIDEVMTSINSLNEEEKYLRGRTLYDEAENRVKTFESTATKLEQKGLPKSIDAVESGIHDVAGVRIITFTISDVYNLYAILRKHPKFEEYKEPKDYIKEPKDNGYSSFHMFVKVRISFDGMIRSIPVEIQIRTLVMDVWAKIHHRLVYQNTKKAPNVSSETEKTQEFLKRAKGLRDFDIKINGWVPKNTSRLT